MSRLVQALNEDALHRDCTDCRCNMMHESRVRSLEVFQPTGCHSQLGRSRLLEHWVRIALGLEHWGLEFWNTGFWSSGTLGSRVLEHWNTGVLDHWVRIALGQNPGVKELYSVL